MLEKEAKEYAQGMAMYYESAHGSIPSQFEKYLRKAVEYGYNKANEWHYMKDVQCYEDLPHNEDVYYAYVVNVGAYDKPITERRLGSFSEFEFDVMAYHVIAWKEIVLPKEIE